jgi:signal transduction histidine kinase
LYELTHRGYRDANIKLEQAIRELCRKNEELERATRDLKLANETVREANGELEAFSHTVAHDLRSPLQAVIGFAELLEDGLEGVSPKLSSFARQIMHTGQHMNQLIDALLDFARNARGEVHSAAVDLSAIASRVMGTLRGEYRRTEIVIAPDLHACGDAALIEIVLTNLLSNALKYSAQSAAPRVNLGQVIEVDGVTTFFVHDNGAGFDMADAHKLFGMFQRLHSADSFKGHGVGLATVQRIIRRHGGDIWADGAVGEGATFYFTLAPPPAGSSRRAEAAP